MDAVPKGYHDGLGKLSINHLSLTEELLLDECQKLADETGIDVQRLIYALMFLSNQGESFEEFADRIRRQVQGGYL